MATPDPAGSNDQRIVEIVREIATQLDVPRFPRKVVWSDSLPGSRGGILGSDECLVWDSQIILAKRMQGKLEPNEWRPIVASSLILHSKLRKNVLRKIFARLVLPPLLPCILAIVLFGQGFNSAGVYAGPSWIVAFFVITLFALILIPAFLYGDYYQKAKLIADRQAAELVGQERFLEALKKIDQMGLKDVEKTKGKHRGSPRLGLDRRISNLQGYPA
jgi:hypothetical protein